MQTLLVLTDLTENSANAYQYAVQLAGQVQATIKLVYSTNGIALSLPNHLQQAQKLQSFANRYVCFSGTEGSNLQPECLIANDPWPEALPLLVNVHQPDLIIAGSGLLDQLEVQGKTLALELLEQYPLLWIPEKANYQTIRNLAFITDFTDQDPGTIEQVKRFAGIFKAEVSLLHFYAPKDRAKVPQIKKEGDLLHRYITPAGTPYFLKEEENLVKGLDEFIQDNPIDLFVVATRDTYLANQYLKSDYSQYLACNHTIPLLNLYQAKKKSCAGNCSFCKKQHAAAEPVTIQL
ncbi:universal stress protein [Adhaeribacter swui]|uniref:Universal stress protein n=1 Tax=Adhaeribacter swui TaxID=2086471 RepID=A0A7G7G913_9BACT|nr:universal stress protein [Adhaeribacter swui]QNF33647.1 universal stress protein [Adhaeribacter swui]